MTTQEQAFANEYVFQYFNSEDRGSWTIAIEAAKYAGYTLPESKLKAEEVVKALYNLDEVKIYIEGQIVSYKAKLNPTQRRTLWAAIEGMTVGDPGEWEQHGLIESNI